SQLLARALSGCLPRLTLSYAEVGYALAAAAPNLLDQCCEEDELSAKLEELRSAIWGPTEQDDALFNADAVLNRFDREFPRCMKLIPRSRREQFLRGVYRFTRVERQDIFSL
ncbi:MAG TPA: hypothetical protein VGZ22_05600, partial [Isosphaeraceae bacterium]|nr:hypothetical protein [Isosphaeraceae bacterium]